MTLENLVILLWRCWPGQETDDLLAHRDEGFRYDYFHELLSFLPMVVRILISMLIAYLTKRKREQESER